MSFVALLDAPLYTGAPSTSETPFPFDVSIGGHPYMVSTDPQANEKWGVRFQQTSNSPLREQADTSDTPGEQSISPNQLWRRSIESWHLGAGQNRYDRKTSSPYRFARSQGVDVWTEGQLSLLDGVTFAGTMASTVNASACTAGSRLYMGGSSNTLNFYTDPTGLTAATAVTGTPASALLSIASDGANVWAAYGTNGVYKTTTTTTTATSYNTGATCTLVGYYKGRLLVADTTGKLYNPTASGALPANLLDLSARSWTWTAFGEGPTCIYAAGYSGDQSLIYAITVKSDGTGLNVPTVAATLPAGEIVRAMYGYLGFVCIGTDSGVRFANPDSSGNLTLGGLINDGAPVYGFAGQDRFVYFTWSAFAAGTAGVGRMDLSQFTSDLTPAYATDLMYDNPLDQSLPYVRNVVIWQGLVAFTYEQGGATRLRVQDNTQTATVAWIETGTIGFGIGDPKAAMSVDLRHDPLPAGANITVSFAADQGVVEAVGVSRQTGSTGVGRSFNLNQTIGETFSLRLDFNLTQWGLTNPIVHRITLRAKEQATRISDFSVPLLLHEIVNPDTDVQRAVDVQTERDYLTTLWRGQKIIPYQEGDLILLVTVVDFEWLPVNKCQDGKTFQGTYVAHLREVLN
jgi:hypothetical protein